MKHDTNGQNLGNYQGGNGNGRAGSPLHAVLFAITAARTVLSKSRKNS
jgi:hypothetical protein